MIETAPWAANLFNMPQGNGIKATAEIKYPYPGIIIIGLAVHPAAPLKGGDEECRCHDVAQQGSGGG